MCKRVMIVLVAFICLGVDTAGQTDKPQPGITADAAPPSKAEEKTAKKVPTADIVQALTPQPAPHYVKTKYINLSSNITVGPSGLNQAQLWAADEKLVWTMVKQAGPRRAPPVSAPDKTKIIPMDFEYAAEKDGLYNFIIIVENHRGPSRRTPKQGEAGDVQVTVDTTKPTVEIQSTRVEQSGDHIAVVDIRWKASDANIAPVPIKLEYQAVGADYHPSEYREWKAIVPDWIDNTGQHTWTAPTGEHHLFLIRVTCKDRAGNEASAVTPKPANVDLTKLGVGPIQVAPSRRASNSEVSDIQVGPAPAPIKRP